VKAAVGGIDHPLELRRFSVQLLRVVSFPRLSFENQEMIRKGATTNGAMLVSTLRRRSIS
jgi:hypothetical protein